MNPFTDFFSESEMNEHNEPGNVSDAGNVNFSDGDADKKEVKKHQVRRSDEEAEKKEAKKHQVRRYLRCSFRIAGALLCILFATLGVYIFIDDWGDATSLYTFCFWFASSMGFTMLGVVGSAFEAMRGPQTVFMCFVTAVFYFFLGCCAMGEVEYDTISGTSWKVVLTIFGMLSWIVCAGRIGLAFVANSWVYVSQGETDSLV